MRLQESVEVVWQRAIEPDARIEAPRPHGTTQYVPKRDPLLEQLLESVAVLAVDTEQGFHDWPERVPGVRVVLLFGDRSLAGQAAEDQDSRVAARDGRESLRAFHRADSGLPLQYPPREHLHVACMTMSHDRIISRNVHCTNRLAQQSP